MAKGDILVFSDANSIYAVDALRQLVRSFADARVGCVCGELHYTNPQRAAAGKGEGSYWRYEQYLKRRESLLGSLVGANGSIYALRRELFEELDPAIISDFIMANLIGTVPWVAAPLRSSLFSGSITVINSPKTLETFALLISSMNKTTEPPSSLILIADSRSIPALGFSSKPAFVGFGLKPSIKSS